MPLPVSAERPRSAFRSKRKLLAPTAKSTTETLAPSTHSAGDEQQLRRVCDMLTVEEALFPRPRLYPVGGAEDDPSSSPSRSTRCCYASWTRCARACPSRSRRPRRRRRDQRHRPAPGRPPPRPQDGGRQAPGDTSGVSSDLWPFAISDIDHLTEDESLDLDGNLRDDLVLGHFDREATTDLGGDLGSKFGTPDLRSRGDDLVVAALRQIEEGEFAP